MIQENPNRTFNFSIVDLSARLLPLWFCFHFSLNIFNDSLSPPSLSSYLYRISGIFLISLWLLSSLLKDKPFLSSIHHPFTIAFIALNALHFIYIYPSSSPEYAINFCEHRLWATILILIFLDLHSEDKFKDNLFRTWLFCFGILLIYGIYQLTISLPHLRQSFEHLLTNNPNLNSRLQTRMNSDEIFSVTIYPNIYALILCMGLSSLFLISKKGKTLLLTLPIILISLYSLYLTGSKGAYLSITLAILISFISLLFYKDKLKLSLTLLITTLIFGITFYLSFSHLFSNSIFIRLGYWQSTLAIIKDNLLGIGTNQFSQYYNAYMTENATEVTITHNDHLQTLCELGIYGFLVYIIFHFILFKHCIKHLSQEQSTKHITKATYFLPTGVLIILSLFLIDFLISSGSFSIGHQPFIFFSAIIIIFLVVLKIKISTNTSQRIFPLFIFLNFIIHSSIDFPYQDHNYWSLFLILTLLYLKPFKSKSDLTNYIKYPFAILLLSLSLWGAKRHQVDLTSELFEHSPASTETFLEFHQHCVKNDNNYKAWNSFYNYLNQNRKISELTIVEKNNYIELCVNKLLAFKPRSSHLNLIKAHFLDKKTEAEYYYLNAIKYHQQNPNYKAHYANYLNSTGRDSEAIKWYKLALERHSFCKAMSSSQTDFKLHLLKPALLKKAQLALKNISP